MKNIQERLTRKISRLFNLDEASDDSATYQQLSYNAPVPCKLCRWPGTDCVFEFRTSINMIYSEVLASASSGKCPACAVLVAVLNNVCPDTEYDYPILYANWEGKSTSTPGFSVRSKERLSICTKDPVSETQQTYKFQFFVPDSWGYIDEQTEAKNGLSHGRFLLGDTSSVESLDWTRGWIEYCGSAHARCLMKKNAPLPTRVIDVGTHGDSDSLGEPIKLIDKAHELPPAPYITLSYCWGGVEHDCITKDETLEARKTDIPHQSLPRLFQDAVNFTRGLNIRYLWIDSICIIQGNEADWRNEAGRMHQVYGNSYVTLAAVRAKSCNDSLFSTMDLKHTAFPVTTVSSGGKIWNTYARQILPTLHERTYPEENATAPLFNRAWAYQERLLAPRVVYFTEQELFWGCFESEGCECLGYAPMCRSVTAETFNSPDPSLIKKPVMNRVEKRWRQIVSEYSHLHLTMPRDKLPAISGIAKQHHMYRPNDRYIAGMWLNSFMDDLLWSRVSETYDASTYAYVAPSWSWASVNAAVFHFQLPEYYEQVQRPLLIDVTCKNVQNDQFGQVESGSLTLLGKLARFSFQCTEGVWSLKHHTTGHLIATRSLRLDSTRLDNELMNTKSSTAELEKKPVYLFNMIQNTGIIHCLMLVKTGDAEVYNRVGKLSALSEAVPQFRNHLAELDNIFSKVQASKVIIE